MKQLPKLLIFAALALVLSSCDSPRQTKLGTYVGNGGGTPGVVLAYANSSMIRRLEQLDTYKRDNPREKIGCVHYQFGAPQNARERRVHRNKEIYCEKFIPKVAEAILSFVDDVTIPVLCATPAKLKQIAAKNKMPYRSYATALGPDGPIFVDCKVLTASSLPWLRKVLYTMMIRKVEINGRYLVDNQRVGPFRNSSDLFKMSWNAMAGFYPPEATPVE